MTSTAGRDGNPEELGRGQRTRAAILEASRQCFLEHGYAGTSINAIAAASGVSRANFYVYFKDKHEVFKTLGRLAFHDIIGVLNQWADTPRPITTDAVRVWVESYFAYLDRHGAFVLAAAHFAPNDKAFQQSRDRMLTRAAWKLGQALDCSDAYSPEVMGMLIMGLLDRAWHSVQTQSVRVDRDEVVSAVADIIFAHVGQSNAGDPQLVTKVPAS
ncbi:TetR/AcrR family transcriptional regulator [Mycobacterium genavense]|uniref:TetR/AcrR family transcriptional regulator n=1 Tax=Mycobacterium genavense TaxID=36812 RepID=UPI000472713B|nr:TetR/AcrR family transcriptional regulator [Mycobacterium genavense]